MQTISNFYSQVR